MLASCGLRPRQQAGDQFRADAGRVAQRQGDDGQVLRRLAGGSMLRMHDGLHSTEMWFFLMIAA